MGKETFILLDIIYSIIYRLGTDDAHFEKPFSLL